MKVEELKKYIEKLGITIRINHDIPSARTFFDKNKKRYVIEYNPTFITSEDDLRAALEHELLHIYRGDLLQKNIDKFLYNIASDIVINNILLNAQRMSDKLRDVCLFSCPGCGFSEWEKGAMHIYEHLQTHKIEISYSHCYEEVSEEDKEKAEKEWKRIRGKILKDYVEGENVPESIEKNFDKYKNYKPSNAGSGGSSSDNEFVIVYPKPKPNRVLMKIKKEYSLRQEGKSEFRREISTFRNNRAPYLKRDIEISEYSAMLFIIDVSGSMDKYINEIFSAIKYFEKEIVVEKIFFSDTIFHTMRKYVNAGGGTSFVPVLNFLKKQGKIYDLICIFSDYQFFDIPAKDAIQELRKYARKVICFDENLNLKKEVKEL